MFYMWKNSSIFIFYLCRPSPNLTSICIYLFVVVHLWPRCSRSNTVRPEVPIAMSPIVYCCLRFPWCPSVDMKYSCCAVIDCVGQPQKIGIVGLQTIYKCLHIYVSIYDYIYSLGWFNLSLNFDKLYIRFFVYAGPNLKIDAQHLAYGFIQYLCGVWCVNNPVSESIHHRITIWWVVDFV